MFKSLLTTFLKKNLIFNKLKYPRRCFYLYGPLHNFSYNDPDIQKFINTFNTTAVKFGSNSTLIGEIVTSIRVKQSELKELETLGNEHKALKDIAASDCTKLQKEINNLVSQFLDTLLESQSEPTDNSDGIILEVSTGVGGQEAMLFTEEIFTMYKSFANYNGWEFDTLSYSETELGGVRQASGSVKGPNVYRLLKFEAGVHRVQRVPKTEKSGRIHTSTSTVAILPTPSEIEIVLNPSDLKIETKRSTGAGGQNVNKTESAVRLTHIPSGISIDSQSQRSQIQNKSNALMMLRAKLYELQIDQQQKYIQSSRKLQVGTRMRSEKIRTYNFPQDRLTDHRIGLTLHNIHSILSGGEELGRLLNELQSYDKRERLNSIIFSK